MQRTAERESIENALEGLRKRPDDRSLMMLLRDLLRSEIESNHLFTEPTSIINSCCSWDRRFTSRNGSDIQSLLAVIDAGDDSIAQYLKRHQLESDLSM